MRKAGLFIGDFTLMDILLGGHELPRALARGLGLPLLIGL
jgi:hypothetical protein